MSGMGKIVIRIVPVITCHFWDPHGQNPLLDFEIFKDPRVHKNIKNHNHLQETCSTCILQKCCEHLLEILKIVYISKLCQRCDCGKVLLIKNAAKYFLKFKLILAHMTPILYFPLVTTFLCQVPPKIGQKSSDWFARVLPYSDCEFLQTNHETTINISLYLVSINFSGYTEISNTITIEVQRFASTTISKNYESYTKFEHLSGVCMLQRNGQSICQGLRETKGVFDEISPQSMHCNLEFVFANSGEWNYKFILGRLVNIQIPVSEPLQFSS